MNKLQQKLTQKEKIFGSFSALGSAAAAECLAIAGLDFIIIDTEHGPFSDESALEMIRAVEKYGTAPLVRVRDSSRAAILRMLDAGAAGLIIPDVHSLEEARKIVERGKFAPTGRRGFGFSRAAGFGFAPEMAGPMGLAGYCQSSNERALLIPQCETAGALAAIEAIAALEGIDGIFVGPYDLSVALGQTARFETEEFQHALDQVLLACAKAAKPALIYANNRKDAEAFFARGFAGVATGVDLTVLIKAYKELIG